MNLDAPQAVIPKIRDEILEDAVALGGMGFSAHFGQREGGWFPVNRLRGRFFAVRAGIFESFRHRYGNSKLIKPVADNLTRVMNIVGVKPLLAAVRA